MGEAALRGRERSNDESGVVPLMDVAIGRSRDHLSSLAAVGGQANPSRKKQLMVIHAARNVPDDDLAAWLGLPMQFMGLLTVQYLRRQLPEHVAGIRADALLRAGVTDPSIAAKPFAQMVAHPLWPYLPQPLRATLLNVDLKNADGAAQTATEDTLRLDLEQFFFVLAFDCFFSGTSDGPFPPLARATWTPGL